MLSYASDMCAQVIVDFDIAKQNFTFIDRNELFKNGAGSQTVVDTYSALAGMYQLPLSNQNLTEVWD